MGYSLKEFIKGQTVFSSIYPRAIAGLHQSRAPAVGQATERTHLQSVPWSVPDLEAGGHDGEVDSHGRDLAAVRDPVWLRKPRDHHVGIADGFYLSTRVRPLTWIGSVCDYVKPLSAILLSQH